MSAAADFRKPVRGGMEPTKDQWLACVVGRGCGRVLDGFDFTLLLLIMVPISREFGVPLIAVTVVFTVTLWLRSVSANRFRLARRSHRGCLGEIIPLQAAGELETDESEDGSIGH